MPDQCTHAVKNARAREAGRIAVGMKLAFLDSQIGLTLPVLFESGGDEETAIGHSDNYRLVRAPGTDLRGQIRQVRIRERKEEILYGVID